MNNYLSDKIKNWWPVAAWMSLIFLFSTELFSGANTSSFLRPLLSSLFPAMTADQIDTVHLTMRKLGHWSEYFMLAVLIARALNAKPQRQSQLRRATCAIAIATLYAVSDEWHQSFVPSRNASIVDVLIDCCGAITGALWHTRHSNIGRKNEK